MSRECPGKQPALGTRKPRRSDPSGAYRLAPVPEAPKLPVKKKCQIGTIIISEVLIIKILDRLAHNFKA